jgi:UDP:flavonoid glycosyltransferase YjiC (YdhE family)
VSERIVIATFGSFGDVNPYVGLALGLKQRGYSPVIATAEFYRSYVEGEGIGFRPVRPDVDPHDADAMRRVMDPKRGTEYLFKEFLFPRVRESYKDLSEAVRGADLLVTHPVTFAGPLVAEKERVAWASTVLAPISFFSAHDLPVFSPFPWLAALRRFGPGIGRPLVGLVKRSTRQWTEPVRRLRADLGLPLGKDPVYEGQFSPRLVLAMFSRVLAQPMADWPPNVRITGQVFHDGPSTSRNLPPGLERFLCSGPAPVVFTLGTSAVEAAGGFYRESLDAAKHLGIRAVLLVGKNPKNRPPGPLPEGVAAFDYAPFSAIFPRAAAVVHQGGIGTMGQALRSGRPMLVVPFAHDQPDNALRVKRLGVARLVYPRHYSARRVAGHLRALLEVPGYRDRASEIARLVRSEDGVGSACEAIEELLTVAQRPL